MDYTYEELMDKARQAHAAGQKDHAARFVAMAQKAGTAEPEPAPEPVPQKGVWDRVKDIVATGANITSGIAAEPIAGLAGLVNSIQFGSADRGVDVMNTYRDALTAYEDDKDVQDNLAAIGDSTVGKIAKGYDDLATGGSDWVYEKTGSPTLATAARVVPDAAVEALGLGSAKKAAGVGKHLNRPEVRRLRQMGVTPTVGQTIGGAANAVEERLSGILPGVASARSRAIDDFQLGSLNKAMEPLGVKIDKIGVEGIEQAQRAVDDVYDSARAAMPEMEITDSLYGDVAEILSDFSNSANASDSITRVETIIENNVMPMLDRGKATGATVKNVDASLNKIIDSSDVPEIKNALKEIQHRIRQEAASQSPEYAALVSKADAAFSGLAAIEKAAGGAGVDGVFTPAHLKRAAKDKASRREKARGGRGPMAEPAGDAVSVLGNKIPDSGTAARMGVAAGAGGLGYGVSPLIPAGMLGAYIGSTRPMQAGANAVLRKAVPYGMLATGAGMAGLPIATQLGEAKEREKN